MFAREAVGIVCKKQKSFSFFLQKLLQEWKSRRTFAPANEKGTPLFSGAVFHARSAPLFSRKIFIVNYAL